MSANVQARPDWKEIATVQMLAGDRWSRQHQRRKDIPLH